MPRQLSTNVSQIKHRIRRRAKNVDRDVEMYLDQLGKPIESWDLEELARGRPRAKDGSFKGRAPEWITPTVIREAKRRLMTHTLGSLGGQVDLAIATVVKILKDDRVDDYGRPVTDSRTKLAAAQFVIENIVGKPKQLVEVEAADTVKQFLAAALVVEDEDGQYVPAHPVIDGQFKEDGDEEYDDDDDA